MNAIARRGVLMASIALIACTGGDEGGCAKQQAPAKPKVAPVAPPLPSGGISGSISAEGSALPGARVCAWKQGPRHLAVREDVKTPRCTSTDESGGYSLTLEPGVWAIVAWAHGHLPNEDDVVLRASKPTAPLSLNLERGGQAFTGTIVDRLGAPVEGAVVDAIARLGRPYRVVASTTTDAAGRYELWSTEDAEISASAPGYARLIHREDQPSVLLPESVIAGRVVDREGKPVAGARVAYIDQGFAPSLGFPHAATRTNEAGEFRLTELMPGEYGLLSFDEDAGGHSGKLHVGFAETLGGVEIELERPLERLRARVVDRGGEPVGICMVLLSPKSDDALAGLWIWTDEEGLLDMPAVASRYHVVGLSCPGFVGTPLYEPIDVVAAGAEFPVIEVEPGRALRGRLLDAEGRPLAGRRLGAREGERDYGDGREFYIGDFISLDETTETDAEGRFELGGFAPGSYELAVFDWLDFRPRPSFTIADLPVTEASFTMPASGRIEIHASAQQAEQAINVVHCDADSRGWGERAWSRWTRTDAQGRVVIEVAPVGEHRVAIDDQPSCESGAGEAITVVAGQSTTVELESPDPSAKPELRVRVLDAEGKPAAHAVVGKGMWGPPEAPTRVNWSRVGVEFGITDADGRVHFSGRSTDEGPRSVVAVRPGEFGTGVLRADGELTIRLGPSSEPLKTPADAVH